jgi:L-asparagine transporter-like permease
MATLASGAFILTAIAAAKLTPKAYAYLQGVALFGAIIVWALIFVSHLRFRQRYKAADLVVRMPLFPALQIAGLGLLAALLATMGLDPDWNISWIVGVPWLILLTLGYFIWKRVVATRTLEGTAA